MYLGPGPSIEGAYIAKEKVWKVLSQPWSAWPRSWLRRGTIFMAISYIVSGEVVEYEVRGPVMNGQINRWTRNALVLDLARRSKADSLDEVGVGCQCQHPLGPARSYTASRARGVKSDAICGRGLGHRRGCLSECVRATRDVLGDGPNKEIPPARVTRRSRRWAPAAA